MMVGKDVPAATEIALKAAENDFSCIVDADEVLRTIKLFIFNVIPAGFRQEAV
ncbi:MULTISPECIES: hypothetical protein [Burkholderia]|uniref:hypothetical protein n=1 Tax=Burkholderia cepacia TaxID=292 RepID=UPI0012D4B9F4|nr:hypothetical protein [Burkholderia cepacia]